MGPGTPSPALGDAGLPRQLADAAWAEAYDPAVRASHAEGIALVGRDVGTPVLAVADPERGGLTGIFGPCVSPAPRGEAAGRLWDGTLLPARAPEFHELRRAPAPADSRT